MTQIDADSNTEAQIYHGMINILGQKDNEGFLKLATHTSLQKYNGSFTKDSLHGEGIYTQIKASSNFIYEGTVYANTFEGYAKVIHGNCVYYEGLFKNNQRFGPGVVSHMDGTQDVGFWNGGDLMRLAVEINTNYLPTLARTTHGQLEVLKARKLIPLIPETSTESENLIENHFMRNEKSHFFNRTFYDERFNLKVKHSNRASAINLEDFKKLTSNVNYLEDSTPKEICLLQQKFQILSFLLNSPNEEIPEETPTPSEYSTNMIDITKVLAWNNEEYLVDCLLHAFKHRNREFKVKFATSKLLQGRRNLFQAPGTYETACRLFLQACSDGKDNSLLKLHKQFIINPDVTDSKGNSGIIYAAVRDKIYVIKRLVNLGAKLDIVNDENLTALNLCLLRYVSLLRDINDWENAFLLKDAELESLNKMAEEGDEKMADVWNGQKMQEIVSYSYLNYIAASVDSFNLQGQDQLILHYLNDIIVENKSLDWFFAKLGINLQESHDFQSIYNLSEDFEQKYLFDWRMVPSSDSKSKSNKKKGKNEKAKINVLKLAEEESERLKKAQKLHIISDTIEVLLRLGANPNICDVPVPTIILALYTNSSQLLEMLIQSSVVLTNVYTKNELNLFHILCSLPPSENLHRLAKVLLKCDVDIMQRCSIGHWSDEISKIQGDLPKIPQKSSTEEGNEIFANVAGDAEVAEEEMVEQGKTPLHILATRVDFGTDSEGYLNSLAKVIAKSNHDALDEFYLGHTPLSLAVLRGNINLVRAFLEADGNPNKGLASDLGNALTVYCLKRYSKPKMIPAAADCKLILDLLVSYGANPLLPVGGYGNVLEFIDHDNAPPEVGGGDKDAKGKKGKKDKKDKKLKTTESKKSKSKKSSKSSSKSSKKSKKKGKQTPQNEITEHLIQLGKEVVLAHGHGKLAILLFRKLMEGTIQNFKHLVQFLTHEDGLRVISIFKQERILDLEDDGHYLLAFLLLECINLFGVKEKPVMGDKKGKKSKKDKKDKKSKKSKKSKEKSSKKGSKKSDSSKTTDTNSKSIKLTNQDMLNAIINNPLKNKFLKFEVDNTNTESYKVCYNCGLRTGKVLIACPTCGLVYFCSQKCNLADIKSKSRHPCKTLFYDDELKKKNDKNAISVNNLEVTFKRLPLKLPKQFGKNTIFMELFKEINEAAYDEAKVEKILDLMGLKLDVKNFERFERIKTEENVVELKTTVSRFIPLAYSFSPRPNSAKLFENPSERFNISDNLSWEALVCIASRATVNADVHSNKPLLSNSSEYARVFKTGQKLINKSYAILTKVSQSTLLQKERIGNNDAINEKKIVDLIRPSNFDQKQSFQLRITPAEDKISNRNSQLPDSISLSKGRQVVSKKKSEPILKVSKKAEVLKTNLNINHKFIDTLNKLFPEYDFTTAMAPFVCYSDSQFYYKFSEHKPEYFSTHQ